MTSAHERAAVAGFRLAAARATPLADRGRADAVDQDRLARADRVLARWRAQDPFTEDNWFDRRLATDQHTEDDLRDLLAETPRSLAARCGDADWIDEFAACYRDAEPSVAEDFTVIAVPLLASARRGLASAVAEFGFDGAEAVRLCLPALLRRIDLVVQRTMILELNVARVTGALTAASAQGRFAEFVAGYADPDAALTLFAEYPVLARLLSVIADNWVRQSRAVLARYTADRADLAATFGGLGPLTAIEFGLGDVHRGGATVAILTFGPHQALVYKPRPVEVDLHFQELLDWLNPKLALPLRTLRYLPRPGYGWVEYVPARPCADPAELGRFYHRCGTVLGLMYLLEGTDCHGENLIAAGDQPVLVDLETLLQPRMPLPDDDRLTDAERDCAEDGLRSVLRSGMLPVRIWRESEDQSGVDVSALGRVAGQELPGERPTLHAPGTDELRVEYAPGLLTGSRNLPSAEGEANPVRRFLTEIDAGFTEIHQLLRAHRAEARPFVLAFARDETRFLRRATKDYASLLNAGSHPDLLRDALDRDRHFDQLWRLIPADETALPYERHERAELWHVDVPMFTVRPGDDTVRTSTGQPIPGTRVEPGLTGALATLDRLDAADLDRQRWLIRCAITSTTTDLSRVRDAATYECRPADQEPDRDLLATRAVEMAARIGDRLADLAYRDDTHATWLGANVSLRDGASPGPVRADLYSGQAGIALFLDRLAAHTASPEHRTLADGAIATLCRQIETDRLPTLGGLSGLGGILYALSHLHATRPSAELRALAGRLVAEIDRTAADDLTDDVVAGSAGNIGGLLAWHAVEPGPGPLRAIQACADQLVARAVVQETGVGWLPRYLTGKVNGPLAGFAHGVAGIAWALVGAARVLGDARYLDTALAGIAYERTLFDVSVGNWRDLRVLADREMEPVLHAWCHGAAGIGLSRVGVLDAAGDAETSGEIQAAVAATLDRGFGVNFSLCHGDIGSLDLLLAVEHPSTWRYTAAVLAGMDQHGWVSGLPGGIENPALLVGLAGTGYQLLRLADPATTPSVLLLAPPPR